MPDHKRLPSALQEFTALLLPAATLVAFAVAHEHGVPESFAQQAPAVRPAALRVCADPNNLPFSNRAGEGFENRIARVIGAELSLPVAYTWWAQRRGFVRNTLNAGACDLVVGVASGVDMLATTRPYYRSSYVFVSRRDRHVGIQSFDDARLRRVRIGVELIGDDFANTPPAHALARRGITANVVGYTVYGDYRKPDPAADIMRAVERGAVDVAVVWGPLAGYFAKRSPVPLDLTPVSPSIDRPNLPFVFDIAMGVRRRDTTFRRQIERIIERRRPAIDSILAAYGVPRADKPTTSVATRER
ncbi:MAG TPA: substrate-binding domain-containing protein [Gemmatimonadaceae bacterium]|jgi:mxaJ protein|nr:substrate-binding domain-containing protein [Gemmatimonadaceae bacterium]